MNTITIHGGISAVTIHPDAIARRDSIVQDAAQIASVTTQAGAEAAQRHIAALAAIRTETEKARKAAKAPVLDAGKLIDKTADEFTAPAAAEEKRLSGLVAAFIREEQEKARRAAEEAARIERERREAELKAERERLAAERAAFEAEQAAARAKAAGDAAAAKAAAEAEAAAKRAQVEAENAEFEAAIAASSPPVAELVPAVPSKGVREELDFDVTDAAKLAAEHPELVTITPKRAEILRRINAGFTVAGIQTRTVTKIRGIK